MEEDIKKALFILLYDQFNIPDIEQDDRDSDYIEHIVSALIEKNEDRCPFKCYDCIGKCKVNHIGCAEGFKFDCNRVVEEAWKDFIGIEGYRD